MKILLSLSVGGALLGVFLMILRKITGGKLPSGFFYYAWLLVLLRFILPAQGLMPVKSTAPETAPAAANNTVITQQYTVSSDYNAGNVQEYHPPVEDKDEKSSFLQNIKPEELLTVIWFCGNLIAFAIPAVSYFRFSHSLRKTLGPVPKYERSIYNGMTGKHRPQLAESGFVHTPITIGIFSPVLVLPKIDYDEAMLRNIYAHELTHFKRRDIARKWFTLFVFAAHWFNPFVYLFRRELDALCELSCDEAVIRKMGRAEKQEYGETLISIAQDAPKLPTSMATGVAGEKENLKERLVQIMKYKKKGKFAIIAAILAAVILVGCGAALGPAKNGDKAQGTVEAADVDTLLSAIAPDTEIHLAAGTYNLTEAKNYGNSTASDYYRWNSNGFDGEYALDITGVENLKITGDGAEIVTVPRSVNVIKFTECGNVELSGLTVGHTEAAQACEGGVIYLDRCKNFSVNSCSLYGCGTIGIYGSDCDTVSVSDTDIHHCSACAVNIYQSKNITVTNCRMYDFGRDGASFLATSIFVFSDTQGVNVKACEVYENKAERLVHAYNIADAVFDSLNVHDNHFSKVFGGSGHADINGITLADNSVDEWFAAEAASSYSFDGEMVSEETFAEKYADQLSSSGIGEADVDYQNVDMTGTKEVHVNTADEFIASLASDTAIYIDVPQINLTDASGYGVDAAELYEKPEFSGDGCTWRSTYDGYELCIVNMKNLHIIGGEIVTEPRYANVLNFYDCSNISLENTKLGHTVEQGQCIGGVVYLNGSEDIIIESCDLYGCGIRGIQASDVKNLNVQNTVIHDCTMGAALFSDSQTVTFLGCTVRNCPEPHITLQNCGGFSWDKKLMDSYCSFNVSESESADASSLKSTLNEDTNSDEEKAAHDSTQYALNELYEMGILGIPHTLKTGENSYFDLEEAKTGFFDRKIPECYYANCPTEEGDWVSIFVDKETGKALACSIDIYAQDGDEKLDREPIDTGNENHDKIYYYDSFDRLMREDMTLDEFCTSLCDYWGFDGYTISGTKYEDYGYDTEAPAGDTLIKDLMDKPFVTVYFDGDQDGVPMFIELSCFPGHTHFSFGYTHMVG